MHKAIAIAAALLLGQAADAATVTRDFSVTAASFNNFFGEAPPFRSLAIRFRVTYDDTANGFMGALDSFTATTDGQVNAGPFSATPSFGYFQPSAFSTVPRLVVGGALNGTNVLLNGTNDFFFSFDASAATATRAMLGFTTVNNRVPFLADDASVSPVTVSAVPEPAGWALMIGGFGLVGAVLRRAGPRATPAREAPLPA